MSAKLTILGSLLVLALILTILQQHTCHAAPILSSTAKSPTPATTTTTTTTTTTVIDKSKSSSSSNASGSGGVLRAFKKLLPSGLFKKSSSSKPSSSSSSTTTTTSVNSKPVTGSLLSGGGGKSADKKDKGSKPDAHGSSAALASALEEKKRSSKVEKASRALSKLLPTKPMPVKSPDELKNCRLVMETTYKKGATVDVKSRKLKMESDWEILPDGCRADATLDGEKVSVKCKRERVLTRWLSPDKTKASAA
ncbi:hypothetical protein SYNPS1DRAFT_28836 [Syncephalis pseudoplumigaleata]|uniref:Uncharacterized protein n=1 Tax=Syncephalis pseudoplumigaleata TaxID=1712513 RepID=A0A4P9YZ72_9FUNG|nr:hypothetical protein SYNPS1DRAFT_28836 [Syncephalis pseudoplumigaleata]|eukprot:RKP25437.1 hypothetical protein SYNPS1DRAFT_28836 [Syncephalis pseudoplumigaleata]